MERWWPDKDWSQRCVVCDQPLFLVDEMEKRLPTRHIEEVVRCVECRRALLYRSNAGVFSHLQPKPAITVKPIIRGDVTINMEYGEVRVRGQPVLLTLRELRFLLCLVKNFNRPVSKETVAREVWGYPSEAVDASLSNLIQVVACRVRDKLCDAVQITYVADRGYRLFIP